MPRVISDALYKASIKEKLMKVAEFKWLFEILLFGDARQQIALIFLMLDSNQDGKITKEECHSLISLVPLRLN